MGRAASILACCCGTAALAALALCPGTASARSACDVRLQPSEDIAAKVAAAPANSDICLTGGEYRITEPLRPAAGQTIEGIGKATMSGAQQLTSFHSAGPNLWAAGFTGTLGPRTGECVERTQNACQFPNAVFRDGHPLRRVTSQAAVSEGTFWIDAQRNEAFVWGDPHGHTLEIALAPAAIVAGAGSGAAGVTVRGLTILRFATVAQHGAIDTGATGWTIVDDRVEDNPGEGITTQGGAIIEHDKVLENGQEGIGGTGSDTTVAHNLIAGNNWAEFDPGWEAGGGKWSVATDLVVRDNVVRDNKGPGLWSDIDSSGVTYEGNTVTGNERAGIFYEISEEARISHNTVRGNGLGFDVWLWGSGILLAASHNVTVSENTLSKNADGIGLIQQKRGVSERNGLPRVLHAVDITHNHETLGTGGTGMVQDDGDEALFEDPTISFTANHYSRYAPGAFAWDDEELEPSEWQAFGNDTEGVFSGR
jgi:parallel beta-helix repeat protein